MKKFIFPIFVIALLLFVIAIPLLSTVDVTIHNHTNKQGSPNSPFHLRGGGVNEDSERTIIYNTITIPSHMGTVVTKEIRLNDVVVGAAGQLRLYIRDKNFDVVKATDGNSFVEWIRYDWHVGTTFSPSVTTTKWQLSSAGSPYYVWWQVGNPNLPSWYLDGIFFVPMVVHGSTSGAPRWWSSNTDEWNWLPNYDSIPMSFTVTADAPGISKPTLSVSPSQVAVGETCLAFASASCDWGLPISYDFSWGDGTTKKTWTGVSSHQYTSAGTYTVRVNATNGFSYALSDTRTITVTSTTYTKPTASYTPPGDTVQTNTNQIVTPDGNCPHGGTLTYEWREGTTGSWTSATSWTLSKGTPQTVTLEMRAKSSVSNLYSDTFSRNFIFVDGPADEYNVRIRVIDSGTKNPIQGANVDIGGDTKTTGSNGLTTAYKLTKGNYNVLVSKDGYLPLTLPISVSKSEDFDAEMTPSGTGPDDNGIIQILVKDQRGSSVKGATVEVRKGPTIWNGETNDLGTTVFEGGLPNDKTRLSLSEGTYDVFIEKNDVQIADTVEVVKQTSEVFTFELTSPGLLGDIDLLWLIVAIVTLVVCVILTAVIYNPVRFAILIVGISLFILFLIIAMGLISFGI